MKWNVKELKELIEDLDDDTEIVIESIVSGDERYCLDTTDVYFSEDGETGNKLLVFVPKDIEINNAETGRRYTELNDINGDDICEGMTVHQVSVLTGSEEIDFTGEIKFYDGTWYIDNGSDAKPLFSESCENTIIEA